MFSIFTYVMSRVTHSEPGLPMVYNSDSSYQTITAHRLFITKFVCLFEYRSVELPFRARAMVRRNLFLKSKAIKFRRRTSHEPNRMQMRKILCSTSLAFDSAHVKYGV